jgi:Tol biopolymer transport system component
VAPAAPAAGLRSLLLPLAFAAGGLLVGVLAMLPFTRGGARPGAEAPRRFVVAARDSAGVIPEEPVIAPNGSAVAWISGNTLWVRSFDAVEPRKLATANGLAHPFWSPDGRHVGYITGSRVMKVAVAGGDPQLVSDVRKPFTGGAGAFWRDDDVIVCSRAEDDGLLEVSAMGGDPRTLLAPDTTAEGDFHEPTALPGGRGVLYVVHRKQGLDTIELFARGKRKVLVRFEGQSLENPTWSPTGHVLFRRSPQNTGVWALPFSLSRLEATGAPFMVASNGNFPSVAHDGTLVLRTGSGSRSRQLAWVDRAGNVVGTVGEPEEGLDLMSGPAIAPDGVRVAIAQGPSSDESDIWVYDTARGTKTRLTFDAGLEDDPAWTPDGTRIVHTAAPPGCAGFNCLRLVVRSADGTGAPDTLAEGALPNLSPDGHTVVFTTIAGSDVDVATVPLAPGGQRELVVREDESQVGGRVSPNGRFAAYVSFASGRAEVYLKRFPSWTGKWQVSTGGGSSPCWNGAGDRLHYVHEDDFYEVEVGGVDTPVLSPPRKLFSLRPSARGFRNLAAAFDVTRDGQRFLVVRPAGASANGGDVVAVQNWFAEFQGAKKN